MTLYEFNKLDMRDGMETVNRFVTFIHNYYDDEERCNLFAIDMFFVEVAYHNNHNRIKEIRAFKHGHRLDRYSNLSI